MNHGADVNRRSDRKTALLKAASQERCNTEALKLLLDFGADIEVRDREGLTPLCTAARYFRCQSVHTLLDAGANVDGVDEARNRTALFWACTAYSADGWKLFADERVREYDDMVKMLLAAGAQVDVKDAGGATPLHCAMVNARAVAALLLLDAGADPTIKDRDGFTPLIWLLRYKFKWNLLWEE
ncbi:hypothetical protein HDU96_009063, partial [Phlyctochytrium bullatum]